MNFWASNISIIQLVIKTFICTFITRNWKHMYKEKTFKNKKKSNFDLFEVL